jgi:phosphoesterase RecJ-like protein
MPEIDKLKELISTPRAISIVVHKYPDADAIGSALVMAEALTKKGHDLTIVSPNGYPKFLSWMRGIKRIIDYSRSRVHALNTLKKADIVICVDFSSWNRIDAELVENIKASEAKIVVLDHHLDPEEFADLYFWDPKASSTTVIVYDVITALGCTLDKDIGQCIYAGIATDTGLFQYSNANAKAHLIAAKLLDLGVEQNKIFNYIYNSSSISRLKFLGFSLMNRLVIMPEYGAAYFYISLKDQQDFNLQTGDTEGLVNYALSIENITLAAIMIEKDDAVRISLRSVGDIYVNELARLYFNGGGHKNAAGGKSDLSLQESIAKFESIVKGLANKS